MPDAISDTNGKLCVGSYHMWRLLSSPDNYSFIKVKEIKCCYLYNYTAIEKT